MQSEGKGRAAVNSRASDSTSHALNPASVEDGGCGGLPPAESLHPFVAGLSI